MREPKIKCDVDNPFTRPGIQKPCVQMLEANIQQNLGNRDPEMALEAQLQRPDSDTGNPRQFFQIERLGGVGLQAVPCPLEHGGQCFAVRRRPIDRVAEIVALAGEKQPENGLAQGGQQDGRQFRSRPAMLGARSTRYSIWN